MVCARCCSRRAENTAGNLTRPPNSWSVYSVRFVAWSYLAEVLPDLAGTSGAMKPLYPVARPLEALLLPWPRRPHRLCAFYGHHDGVAQVSHCVMCPTGVSVWPGARVRHGSAASGVASRSSPLPRPAVDLPAPWLSPKGAKPHRPLRSFPPADADLQACAPGVVTSIALAIALPRECHDLSESDSEPLAYIHMSRWFRGLVSVGAHFLNASTSSGRQCTNGKGYCCGIGLCPQAPARDGTRSIALYAELFVGPYACNGETRVPLRAKKVGHPRSPHEGW